MSHIRIVASAAERAAADSTARTLRLPTSTARLRRLERWLRLRPMLGWVAVGLVPGAVLALVLHALGVVR